VSLPLAGVTVLDFTEYVAGPYGTMMLADLGAEVLKVEPLEGDHWRRQQPLKGRESRYYLAVNRGKKSIALDAHSEAGRAVIDDLIRQADVVVLNYRPPTVQQLRLDYESVAAIRPDVIYCSMNAFGNRGPYSDKPGFDLLIQAMAGIMDFERKVDRGVPIGITTVAPADLATGMFSAFAIASALYHRSRTGEGQRIDLSLFASALAIQYRVILSIEEYDREPRDQLLATLAAAREQGLSYEDTLEFRKGLGMQRAAALYYRVFETRDGMVAVACLNNRQRRGFRDLLGIEDSVVDGVAFSAFERSEEEHEALMSAFEGRMRQRTTAEWLAALDAADVPVVPVLLTEEVFDNEQALANGLIRQYDHPVLGPTLYARTPVEIDGQPAGSESPPPVFSADARHILYSLGYDDARIDSLADAGIVRLPGA
jgi:crotonobetainyl-CoA:carnitine CoA-transferase CaiB-like acyl-CoA transferase